MMARIYGLSFQKTSFLRNTVLYQYENNLKTVIINEINHERLIQVTPITVCFQICCSKFSACLEYCKIISNKKYFLLHVLDQTRTEVTVTVYRILSLSDFIGLKRKFSIHGGISLGSSSPRVNILKFQLVKKIFRGPMG